MDVKEEVIEETLLRKEDFNKICRVCLRNKNGEDDVRKNIFSLKYKQRALHLLLEELFGDKLTRDDKLPHNLCLKCIVEIIRYYDFKKTYDKSKMILQNLVAVEIKVEPTEDLIRISAVETYGYNDEPSLAETDKYAGDSDNNLDIKEESITEDVEDTSAINVCNSDDEAKRLHQPTVLEGGIIYRCSCGERFISETEYTIHKKENKHKGARRSILCQLCQRYYSDKDYGRHIIIHTKEKPFMCEICSQKFTQHSSLVRHMLIHKGENRFICELCGKCLATSYSLNIHKRLHTGAMPYGCDLCEKKFNDKPSFMAHKARHKGEKSYLCAGCGKSFYTSSALRIHSKKSCKPSAIKTLRHNIPTKRNRRVFDYTPHVSVGPEGTKTYACNLCPKVFTKGATLRLHIRYHTGEKPYVCEFCSKGFADQSSLKVHVRSHTGERPYVCELCSKGFLTSTHLKTHRRRIHFENVETSS